MREARLAGPLALGTTFRWRAGRWTINSTLQRVEPPLLLGWIGKMPGISAVHIYRLEAAEVGTRVHTEESWAGWLPRLLRGPMHASLQGALERGLRLPQGRSRTPRRADPERQRRGVKGHERRRHGQLEALRSVASGRGRGGPSERQADCPASPALRGTLPWFAALRGHSTRFNVLGRTCFAGWPPERHSERPAGYRYAGPPLRAGPQYVIPSAPRGSP